MSNSDRSNHHAAGAAHNMQQGPARRRVCHAKVKCPCEGCNAYLSARLTVGTVLDGIVLDIATWEQLATPEQRWTTYNSFRKHFADHHWPTLTPDKVWQEPTHPCKDLELLWRNRQAYFDKNYLGKTGVRYINQRQQEYSEEGWLRAAGLWPLVQEVSGEVAGQAGGSSLQAPSAPRTVGGGGMGWAEAGGADAGPLLPQSGDTMSTNRNLYLKKCGY